MRRKRRPIAVPTPPCPRVPSHPQPARGRAGPQRGEETTRTTPAGACPRPSTQPQEEARLERPRSPPQSRPASSDQAHRASSVGSHLEGGRGGAPSLHLHHFTLCLRRQERLSDDSFAQGRGLSSATTFYLQAPPPTVLPKPEHRPYCRCPVKNSRVVVQKVQKGGLWEGWVAKNTECISLSLSASAFRAGLERSNFAVRRLPLIFALK